MRESTIESKVCQWARKQGIIVVKLSGPNDRGIPDRMFLKDGAGVFVEFKAPGKKPTALQYKRMESLGEAGFRVAWFDASEDAIWWLRKQFNLK